MSPATGPRLTVRADLDVSVTSPGGRRATVTVGDRDGTLVVDVSDVRAVLLSLPRSRVAPFRAESVLGRTAPLAREVVASWDQPVDVAVAGHLLLRRRDGRWRPTARLAAPGVAAVLLAAAVLVTVVGAAVAGLGAVARAVRGSDASG